MPPTNVKKINVKDILGTKVANVAIKLKADGKEKSIALCRIAGIASAFQQGMSQMGEWFALIGEFAGVNLETGEVFEGMKCFLPKDITTLFIKTLKDNAGASVEFS